MWHLEFKAANLVLPLNGIQVAQAHHPSARQHAHQTGMVT